MITTVLIVSVMLAAGSREPRFLHAPSLESIVLWAPLLAVVGVGQLMVIVTRGIDVSVGSLVGLCAMSVGMILRAHPATNLVLATSIGIAIGAGLGSVNGALIAGCKVPPIITTLGTLSAFRGLVFIISRGVQINSNDIPDALTRLSSSGPFRIGEMNVPWLFVIAIVVVAAASWFLSRTVMGRDIYAFGSHPEAARLRGIPVQRVQFLVYAITGGLCGLAGVLYMSRFGFVNPSSAGQGLELMVIATVAIGGANVSGGSGSALGVLLGAVLLGAINVALAVLGISENWQQLVYGAVILVAVLADSSIRRSLGSAAGELR